MENWTRGLLNPNHEFENFEIPKWRIQHGGRTTYFEFYIPMKNWKSGFWGSFGRIAVSLEEILGLWTF